MCVFFKSKEWEKEATYFVCKLGLLQVGILSLKSLGLLGDQLDQVVPVFLEVQEDLEDLH